MNLCFIFLQSLVEVLTLMPVSWRFVIVSWIWAGNVWRTLDKARSWSSWAESIDFGGESIVHFVLNLWHDLSFLRGIEPWARVRVQLIWDVSILASVEWGGRVSLMVELRCVGFVIDAWAYIWWIDCLPKFSFSLSSLQVNRHICLGGYTKI